MDPTPITFFEAFASSLGAVGKLFLIAATGFFFSRRGLLSQDAINGLTRITIDLIVPCALAVSMLYKFELGLLRSAWPLVVVPPIIILGSAALMLRHFARQPTGEHRSEGAATALASIPNSFYVPFPLALAMTPPEHQATVAALVGIAVLTVNPLQWTVGTVLVSRGSAREGEVRWYHNARHILNGPVLGIFVGAALALVPPVAATVRTPETANPVLRLLVESAELIGAAMAPMAMIVLGAIIGQCRLSRGLQPRLLLPIFAMRFLVAPGLVFLALWAGLLPSVGFLPFVLLLEAASPPATNLALASKRYGGDWETTSTLLFVSNCGAVLFLPIWMALGLRLAG